MDGLDVQRLERLIGATPARNISYERADSKYGEIYFAYGEGPDGKVYALWGCEGIARTVEFNEGARVEDIRQVLVNDASGFMDMRAERGLIG